MKNITITIDGPASSGKGTTAKVLANELSYKYLDTGALYRMVTLYCLENSINVSNEDPLSSSGQDEVKDALKDIKMDFNPDGKPLLGGKDVSKEIRTPLVNTKVSTVFARNQAVRDFVSKQSKKIVAEGGYVLDGRDAGSAIAPNAELKIYLDCDPRERARRRALDFGSDKDEQIDKTLYEIILPRDEADAETIRVAKEQGICIDTTNLNVEEQVEQVKKLALEIINS